MKLLEICNRRFKVTEGPADQPLRLHSLHDQEVDTEKAPEPEKIYFSKDSVPFEYFTPTNGFTKQDRDDINRLNVDEHWERYSMRSITMDQSVRGAVLLVVVRIK